MKLEVGKTYVDRLGRAVFIKEREGAGFNGYEGFNLLDCYREDGSSPCNPEYDIVGEAGATSNVTKEECDTDAYVKWCNKTLSEWRALGNSQAQEYVKWRKDQGIDDKATTRKLVDGIPHADLIRAVLDGKVVQRSFGGDSGLYRTYDTPIEAITDMLAFPASEFRLKPESVVRWGAVWAATFDIEMQSDDGVDFSTKQELLDYAKDGWTDFKCLRLELDPDTLDVIDCRTEAP